MAGKNEVTLTFAGDSTQLEKAFEKVGASAKGLEGDLDRVGQGSSKLDERMRGSGRSTEEYGSKLDRLEESGGRTETTFLGLGAGISGTTTLMQGGKLSAEEMSMAFADLGDFTEHTLAPAMKGVKDKVGAAISSFQQGGSAAGFFKRNLGDIAFAAGTAAVVIGTIGLAIKDTQERQQNITDLAGEFVRLKDTMSVAGAEVVALALFGDDLQSTFDEILKQSPAQAAAFINTAAAMETESGEAAVASDELEIMRGKLDLAAEATQGMSGETLEGVEALKDYADAVRAQFDPLFAMLDAQQQVKDSQSELHGAQLALTEAIREHGAGSMEAMEAQHALTEAQDQARDSVINLEGAATTLRAEIEAGNVSSTDAQRQFIRMATDMGFTREEARRMARQFGFATSEAERLGGQHPRPRVSVAGLESARQSVRDFMSELNALPHRKQIEIAFRSYDTALLNRAQALAGGYHGGIVPSYFAGGGMAPSFGPMGTDTVPAYLTPGEMVLNDAQQAELWSMANGKGGKGGGVNVNLYVTGSLIYERDLYKGLENAIRNGTVRLP